MKQTFLALLLVAGIATAQSTDDFRGLTWGASEQDVRDTETETFLQEEARGLVYTGTVGGKEAAIIYTFSGSGLAQAGYIFQDAYTNRNQYIEEYDKIKDTLSDLYGEPIDDDETWSNDLYQDDPSEYGFAVSLGHLMYTSGWETETTTIRHILNGNNYEISHAVIYNSKELEGETEQEQQEDADEAF